MHECVHVLLVMSAAVVCMFLAMVCFACLCVLFVSMSAAYLCLSVCQSVSLSVVSICLSSYLSLCVRVCGILCVHVCVVMAIRICVGQATSALHRSGDMFPLYPVQRASSPGQWFVLGLANTGLATGAGGLYQGYSILVSLPGPSAGRPRPKFQRFPEKSSFPSSRDPLNTLKLLWWPA